MKLHYRVHKIHFVPFPKVRFVIFMFVGAYNQQLYITVYYLCVYQQSALAALAGWTHTGPTSQNTVPPDMQTTLHYSAQDTQRLSFQHIQASDSH